MKGTVPDTRIVTCTFLDKIGRITDERQKDAWANYIFGWFIDSFIKKSKRQGVLPLWER